MKFDQERPIHSVVRLQSLSILQRSILLLILVFSLTASAQTSAAGTTKFGSQWRFLVGEWSGEGTAKVPFGSCSFQFELGGHILVRTNHAETLSRANSPAIPHDDLMVISPGPTEEQAQATYWDNEGHIIEYTASWSNGGDTLTFLSKPASGPQFRLTYKKDGIDILIVSFDIAPPGQPGVFKTYLSGRLHRQK
jgi:hypothetical protein